MIQRPRSSTRTDTPFPYTPLVRSRQQDLYQRDAGGVAVVQARDERRAALVALDQVELPERPVLVERTRGELAGEAFQRALLRAVARRPAPVALSGQRGELHVPVEVEMRVLLPGRTRRGVDRLLPEARVGQEALFDDALE